MRFATPRRGSPTARPRSAPTAALGTLSFVTLTNALVCGAHAIVDNDGGNLWLRFGAGLAATAVLASWTFVRLRAARNVNQAPAPLAPRSITTEARTTRPRWRRAMWVITALVVAAGAWSVSQEWGSVQAALGDLTHLHWRDVRWAIYAEALSLLALALLTAVLLRTGGRRVGAGAMLGLALAGNALTSSMPGGPAWAATFSVDQLRRRGVSARTATVIVIMSAALSVLALVALLLVGLAVAGGQGPAADVWPYAAGLVLAVGIGLPALAAIARRTRLRRWVSELAAIRIPHKLLAAGFGTALLGWIADCACLVASIAAVSGRVPWQGVLLVYAATQISQAIPFTPGGLGVVEGTASLLLIAYGMPAGTAVAAVMLYRIVSFWLLIPIGWGVAGVLVAQGRRSTAPAVRVRSAPAAVPAPALARTWAGSGSR